MIITITKYAGATLRSLRTTVSRRRRSLSRRHSGSFTSSSSSSSRSSAFPRHLPHCNAPRDEFPRSPPALMGQLSREKPHTVARSHDTTRHTHARMHDRARARAHTRTRTHVRADRSLNANSRTLSRSVGEKQSKATRIKRWREREGYVCEAGDVVQEYRARRCRSVCSDEGWPNGGEGGGGEDRDRSCRTYGLNRPATVVVVTALVTKSDVMINHFENHERE